jgi:murein DD-endopeptidase
MGKSHTNKKVIISNLYNHKQTPIHEGWSVKKTQVLDFRAKKLTYNSHNGTDFSIPVGTKVLTAAPGEVVAMMSEFNRGGLKIMIDHGQGLMTCYAHLARALVEVGSVVKRGEVIALSGYSGLDGFATFPWGIPHVHFNVWLIGVPIDPFPYENNISLWLNGALPGPPVLSDAHDFLPSRYNEQKLNEAISVCKTKSSRNRLSQISELKYRAAHTIIEMNYYPTRFDQGINFYNQTYPRKPVLDLFFPKEDFNGVVFLDEL